MNLVAKEYVAAQDPSDPGVLIVSPFAGAAHELTTAVVANPYDPDAVAEAPADGNENAVRGAMRAMAAWRRALPHPILHAWSPRHQRDGGQAIRWPAPLPDGKTKEVRLGQHRH
jgi:trehalose-6-phosphate synthase